MANEIIPRSDKRKTVTILRQVGLRILIAVHTQKEANSNFYTSIMWSGE